MMITTMEAWVALAGFLFAILTSIVTATAMILGKISYNKEALDVELTALRQAAFEEYKILRREMNDLSTITYREFGESLLALRTKVTEVEIWVRDELTKTRHTLTGSMDMRYHMLEQKLEDIDKRVREMEIRLGSGRA